MLLLEDWDANDLLFTKRREIMSKAYSYIYAKSIMKSIGIYMKPQKRKTESSK